MALSILAGIMATEHRTQEDPELGRVTQRKPHCVLTALYIKLYRDSYSKGRQRLLGRSWSCGKGKVVLKNVQSAGEDRS